MDMQSWWDELVAQLSDPQPNRAPSLDWGEGPEADKRENEYSVQHGLRIFSAYTTGSGDRLWVITERIAA